MVKVGNGWSEYWIAVIKFFMEKLKSWFVHALTRHQKPDCILRDGLLMVFKFEKKANLIFVNSVFKLKFIVFPFTFTRELICCSENFNRI